MWRVSQGYAVRKQTSGVNSTLSFSHTASVHRVRMSFCTSRNASSIEKEKRGNKISRHTLVAEVSGSS
jgi:hypothetical protein